MNKRLCGMPDVCRHINKVIHSFFIYVTDNLHEMKEHNTEPILRNKNGISDRGDPNK